MTVVSVIIPCYNQGSTCGRGGERAFAGRLPARSLVVDDGSEPADFAPASPGACGACGSQTGEWRRAQRRARGERGGVRRVRRCRRPAGCRRRAGRAGTARAAIRTPPARSACAGSSVTTGNPRPFRRQTGGPRILSARCSGGIRVDAGPGRLPARARCFASADSTRSAGLRGLRPLPSDRAVRPKWSATKRSSRNTVITPEHVGQQRAHAAFGGGRAGAAVASRPLSSDYRRAYADGQPLLAGVLRGPGGRGDSRGRAGPGGAAGSVRAVLTLLRYAPDMAVLHLFRKLRVIARRA